MTESFDICERCESIFRVELDKCPVCGGEVVKASKCDWCKEWVVKTEDVAGAELCKNCVHEVDNVVDASINLLDGRMTNDWQNLPTAKELLLERLQIRIQK